MSLTTHRWVGLVVALLVSGCTHVTTVSESSHREVFEKANASLAGRNAVIHLANGQVWKWHDVRASPEFLTGIPAAGAWGGPRDSWGRAQIEVDRIVLVETQSQKRGAMEGAALGAAVGLFLGLWFLGGDNDDSCSSCDGAVGMDMGTLIAVPLILTVPFAGGFIGWMRAARTKIRFR